MIIRKNLIFALIFSAFLLLVPSIFISFADVIFEPEIHINRDCSQAEAEIVFQITIPSGTSISSLPNVIEKILSFYRGLWTGSDPIIRKALSPKDIPAIAEIISSSKALNGTNAIMKTIRAFREVEEQGYTAFPAAITVVSKEKLPLNSDCLLENTSKKSDKSASNIEKIISIYSKKNISEIRKQQINANLNNIAVALFSFRSQYSRFPTGLQELVSSGHLLLMPVNPYTGKILTFVNETGPGSIIFTKPSEERYILTGFDDLNLPIKREFLIRPDVPTMGTLARTKPAKEGSKAFTKKEQSVRIYIFQISQLLNSFYETYDYLPRNITHIAAMGYARIYFTNPFTGKPIQPTNSMEKGPAGSYYYLLIGENSYIISGYGEGGREVIEIHRQFVNNKD
jgi:hypothetical protein